MAERVVTACSRTAWQNATVPAVIARSGGKVDPAKVAFPQGLTDIALRRGFAGTPARRLRR
jgi:hypothetical protein